MNPPLGIALLCICSLVIIVLAGPLRTRLHPRSVDALLALAGSGLALGGLLLVDDVGTGSWIAGPLAVAIMVPLHVRALFAGEGPFRT